MYDNSNSKILILKITVYCIVNTMDSRPKKIFYFVLFQTYSAVGPLQRCAGYGTLMAPVNMPSQHKFSIQVANMACGLSGGYVPRNTPAYRQCAGKFGKRMKSQFQMKTLPEFFSTAADGTPVPGSATRHIICFLSTTSKS